MLLGGALELVYETPLRGDINLAARARYNELAALVTAASSSALQDNGSFGVATDHPRDTGSNRTRISNRRAGRQRLANQRCPEFLIDHDAITASSWRDCP
jgi:hypothetical protein